MLDLLPINPERNKKEIIPGQWIINLTEDQSYQLAQFKEKVLKTKFPTCSAYYSPQVQKCATGCDQCLDAWILYKGVLSKKKKKDFIGSGGEAEVYKGIWHHEKVAFKHFETSTVIKKP